MEDEFYTRKALVKIIDEKYGHKDMPLEAENGVEALEILRNQRVDVVITDVKMPNMDGLELAKRMKEFNSEMIVIIVSGFSEFEYAQKALKCHVRDYILKPVDKEDLYRILDDVFYEIERKSAQRNTDIENKRAAFLAIEQQRIHSILQSNKGKIRKEEIMDLLQLEEGRILYKILLFRYKNNSAKEIVGQFCNTIEERGHAKIFYDYSNKHEIMFFSFACEDAPDYEKDIFAKQLQLIKEMVHKNPSFDLTVGISQTHVQLEEFPEVYGEAKQSLLNFMFFGWGKIYNYNDYNDANLEPIRTSKDSFYRYESGLKNADVFLCINELKKIFNGLIVHRTNALEAMQWACMKLDFIANEVMADNQIKQADQMDYDSFNSIEEVSCYYEGLTQEICQRINQKKKETSIIHSLLEYMNSNYYEQLNLGVMAREIYFMNPSYLSRLFSEEVGDTFSNTLLKIRMKKAKELIEEQHYTITVVATMVGYNNTSHFIKMFKHFYNATPGKYNQSDYEQ